MKRLHFSDPPKLALAMMLLAPDCVQAAEEDQKLDPGPVEPRPFEPHREETEDEEQPAPSKKGKKQSRSVETSGLGQLRLSGRAFAELHLTESSVTTSSADGSVSTSHSWTPDFMLNSARLRVDWKSPLPWLSGRASVGLDISKVRPKDIFLQLDQDWFWARAGQFKLPTSALESSSSWTLPMGRHDAFSEVFEDVFAWQRRRPGMAVAARSESLSFIVGAFETPKTSNWDGTELLSTTTGLHHLSLLSRLELKLGAQELGLWGQARSYRAPGLTDTSTYVQGGADAVGELPLSFGALRYFVDVLAGESPQVHSSKLNEGKPANFLVARGQLALRFGGQKRGEFYVEPFALAGVFDPDLELIGDAAYELALGLNVGFWNQFRASLQGETTQLGDNAPSAFLASEAASRTQAIFQLGATF